MTVSRLRTDMNAAEMVHFAACYELKAEKEQEAIDRAKRGGR